MPEHSLQSAVIELLRRKGHLVIAVDRTYECEPNIIHWYDGMEDGGAFLNSRIIFSIAPNGLRYAIIPAGAIKPELEGFRLSCISHGIMPIASYEIGEVEYWMKEVERNNHD